MKRLGVLGLAAWFIVIGCGSSISDDDPDGDGGGTSSQCTPAQGCDAMDARGEGTCEAIIGTIWNGTACVDIGGCNCAGCDCGALYSDIDACQVDHAVCLGLTTCGGPNDEACGATEYCDRPNGIANGVATGCGTATDTGLCQPRPSDCAGEPSTPNCGCDGMFYPTYCDTNLAGVDVATGSNGTCP
jgi:hypothetical protein